MLRRMAWKCLRKFGWPAEVRSSFCKVRPAPEGESLLQARHAPADPDDVSRLGALHGLPAEIDQLGVDADPVIGLAGRPLRFLAVQQDHLLLRHAVFVTNVSLYFNASVMMTLKC